VSDDVNRKTTKIPCSCSTFDWHAGSGYYVFDEWFVSYLFFDHSFANSFCALSPTYSKTTKRQKTPAV